MTQTIPSRNISRPSPDEYFPGGKYDAEGLYDSWRNGPVHMFTIKGKKYTLTHNNPHLHLQIGPSGQIFLNAGDFRNDLHKARELYFNDVEARTDLWDRLVERYNRDGFPGLEVVMIDH